MKTLLITGRNVGFFSLFLHTIDQCITCAAEGMAAWVEWGPECCPYYDGENIWETFFEQPMLSERPDHFDLFSCNFGDHPSGYGKQQIHYVRQYLSQEYRETISAAIHRWGRLRPLMLARADAFIATLPPGYVAIHIRGTDRQNDAKIFPLEFYLDWLKDFRDRPLVVCADSIEAVEAVKRNYPQAVAYDAIRRPRYADSAGIHMPGQHDPYRIAEDVLMEMLIMARAGLLLHTGSNVSLTSWFWNPDLDDRLAILEAKDA